MTNEEIKTLVQDSVKSAKISNEKFLKDKIVELQNQKPKSGYDVIATMMVHLTESMYTAIMDVVTKSLIEYNNKTNK